MPCWGPSPGATAPALAPEPPQFPIHPRPNPHPPLCTWFHFSLRAARAPPPRPTPLVSLAERVSSFRLETVAPDYQPSIQFRSLRELSVTMTLDASTRFAGG